MTVAKIRANRRRRPGRTLSLSSTSSSPTAFLEVLLEGSQGGLILGIEVTTTRTLSSILVKCFCLVCCTHFL